LNVGFPFRGDLIFIGFSTMKYETQAVRGPTNPNYNLLFELKYIYM